MHELVIIETGHIDAWFKHEVKLMWSYGVYLFRLEYDPLMGLCEMGTESSGSTEGGEYIN